MDKRESWRNQRKSQLRSDGGSSTGILSLSEGKTKPRKSDAVLSELKEIRKEHKRIGVGQLQKSLKLNKASYGTVYRLCKDNGLMAKRKPHSITKIDDEAIAAEDLVKRNFYADVPRENLLNDITEVNCSDGRLYLAATMDCFDGAIIGMAMDDNKRAQICIKAYEAGRQRFGISDNAIIHSDHGSQYTSRAFKDWLKKYHSRQSMGSTGCCYDNARMESFFATLKKELIYGLPLSQLTREEVKRLIFRYIECYYNTQRPQLGQRQKLTSASKA